MFGKDELQISRISCNTSGTVDDGLRKSELRQRKDSESHSSARKCPAAKEERASSYRFLCRTSAMHLFHVYSSI